MSDALCTRDRSGVDFSERWNFGYRGPFPEMTLLCFVQKARPLPVGRNVGLVDMVCKADHLLLFESNDQERKMAPIASDASER